MGDNTIIGKQAKLLKGHPHAGEQGTIETITIVDNAPAVKIDMGLVKGSCYAWAGQWEIAPS